MPDMTRKQMIRDMVWAHVYALRFERAQAAGIDDDEAVRLADSAADAACRNFSEPQHVIDDGDV